MLLPEFAEMLSILSDEGTDFLVVGGYAFGVHHEPRATKDLDIWVRPAKDNARRVMRALRRFGAPLFGLSARDLERPGVGLQIGVPPHRIDILTEIDGVSFDEAWRDRLEVTVERLVLPFLGRASYIKNKQAIVAKDSQNLRPQDRADLRLLELSERPTGRRRRRPARRR